MSLSDVALEGQTLLIWWDFKPCFSWKKYSLALGLKDPDFILNPKFIRAIRSNFTINIMHEERLIKLPQKIQIISDLKKSQHYDFFILDILWFSIQRPPPLGGMAIGVIAVKKYFWVWNFIQYTSILFSTLADISFLEITLDRTPCFFAGFFSRFFSLLFKDFQVRLLIPHMRISINHNSFKSSVTNMHKQPPPGCL